MFLYKFNTYDYETVTLTNVYYPSLEQLTKVVNASMSKEAQANIKFSYNPSTHRLKLI